MNEFFFTDNVGYYLETRNRVKLSGFDLTTHDSYFMIQVEVFTNHILAENVNFMNHKRDHKNMVLKPAVSKYFTMSYL